MKSPRTLVTGVAGFLGSHVAGHCLAQGEEVVGVDNLSGGFARNVPAGVEWEELDLRDNDALTAFWERRGPFDHVHHLAAYAAEGLSHHVRRFNYANNLLASVGLINLAVRTGVRHFVFTSSIAVYGAGQVPLREDTVPRPEDPYGISKLAVELDLAAAAEVFGLRYTVFRPHNVYGERQHYGDRYRNVVGIFINQLLRGEPMTVFGDGRQTRAFSHVDDVAPLIARAPHVEGAVNRTFNVGADAAVSVIDLAHAVARTMGCGPRVTHLPPRPEVVHAIADHARVREVFRPGRSVPLEEGLRRMVAWARGLGPQEPGRFTDLEIPRDLPAGWE